MDYFEDKKYQRAKKKIKDIKGFYSHLTVYIIVNIGITLLRLNVLEGRFEFDAPYWSYLITPFFWGIGLAFHGLHVFQYKFDFFRNWEKRKIQEYMKQEDEVHSGRWS